MSTRPAPSKRSTTAASVPAVKTPCQIHTTAVIADKVQITGPHPVEIGENTIVQPHVKIKAEAGKVTIGRNTTIAERAIIGVSADSGEGDVLIGDYVSIETGAVIEASNIGDGSIIEVNAIVGKGANIGEECKVTPLNKVKAGEVLPSYTVIYGDGQRRIDQAMKDHVELRDAKRKGHEKTVALLQRLIPSNASKWL